MKHKHKLDNTRREFLGKSAVAVTVLTVAPGLILRQIAIAKPNDQAVTEQQRWGLLIDTAKCTTDCTACVNACQLEHGLKNHKRKTSEPHPQDSMWIRKVQLRDNSTGKETVLPIMCQHCENPPCVDVCPTGASFKRQDSIVLVDKHICIGCRYCMMSCPYKARSFVHEKLTEQEPHSPRGKGTVEACTLCVHRIDEGRSPACVESCQASGKGGMLFGDLKDPNSTIRKQLKEVASQQIRSDMGLNPGVRYRGL